MKPIRNIGETDMEVPFNFNTYYLPKNKTLLVPDALFDFLKDSFPMSFSFDVEVKKEPPVAKFTKTPVKIAQSPTESVDTSFYTQQSQTREATFGNPDITPPSGTVDADGVQWVGEGIEIEGGSNGS